MTTSRGYSIVINNYTVEQYEKLCQESHDYMVIAKEVGEGTEATPEGTPHLQAYIYKKSKISFAGLKKRNPTAHIEPALGNAQHNHDYCKKGEQPKKEWEALKTKGPLYGKNADFKEFGTLPEQGKRTDLEEIATAIMKGETTVEKVLETQPTIYHNYGRTLNALEDLKQRKLYRKETTTCIWYHGPTGTGKSHTAFLNFTPETHYVYKNSDKGWWDGYKQQETVIINEFRGSIPYSFLLELIDKYPVDVPRRGREPMPFLSKKIIITSALIPEEIYHNLSQHDSLEQLYRRIQLIDMAPPIEEDELRSDSE